MTDIADFDENGVGIPNGNFAGLPGNLDTSKIIFIPARWDATVSFKEGARFGPDAILAASTQLGVYDEQYPEAWKTGGMFWHDALPKLPADSTRASALDCIQHVENRGKPTDESIKNTYTQVNNVNAALAMSLRDIALPLLGQGKVIGLVGGDHSTPLGLMHALAEHHGEYSIVQVDAHFDLYNAFEGFPMSHASIMFNASKLWNIKHFAHIGIRSLAKVEMEYVAASQGRHRVYSDRTNKGRLLNGESWHSITDEIVSRLSDKVYVSFDIDGLDPSTLTTRDVEAVNAVPSKSAA